MILLDELRLAPRLAKGQSMASEQIQGKIFYGSPVVASDRAMFLLWAFQGAEVQLLVVQCPILPKTNKKY